MAVFSKTCTDCMVGRKFVQDIPESDDARNSFSSLEAILYDEKTDALEKIEFTGSAVPVSASFGIMGYRRATNVDLSVFGITSASAEF